MPRPTINLTGKVYGLLKVIGPAKPRASCSYWLCECACGKRKEIKAASPKVGNSRSCGCSRGNSHGFRSHELYGTWKMMRHRCYNPKSKSYARYGGRGIKVCKRWLNSFENFIKDMGDRPPGMTLDKKNVNGDYRKSNCRWATPQSQANNRRNKK